LTTPPGDQEDVAGPSNDAGDSDDTGADEATGTAGDSDDTDAIGIDDEDPLDATLVGGPVDKDQGDPAARTEATGSDESGSDGKES
jgi:hypothetical protein